MAALWSRFSGWIAAAGAAVLVMAGIFLAGRRSGKQSAKTDNAEAAERDRRKAQEVTHEVDSLDNSGLLDAGRKWVRGDK